MQYILAPNRKKFDKPLYALVRPQNDGGVYYQVFQGESSKRHKQRNMRTSRGELFSFYKNSYWINVYPKLNGTGKFSSR